MVAALAASGVKGSHAITGVLVYRVISLKGGGTIWGLLYLYARRRRRRAVERQAVPDLLACRVITF